MLRLFGGARRGISIIEVIVTLAVAGVLVSVALPSFGTWLEGQRVRSEATSIHAGIQLARAEALARNARVRFTLGGDGNWAVACVATSPGCPGTATLHARSGLENRGGHAILVNSAESVGTAVLTFVAQGRPDTAEGSRIQQIDVTAAAAGNAGSSSRAARIVVSDFGRTRMCFPHASIGSPTRC